MLGIHGVGRDGADYYLSDLARELPVAGPGRWAGNAAAGLGLAGGVGPDDFRRLLEGRHPRTGLMLGSGRVSVAAIDLTFSAPKSASVLFALGGPEVARTVASVHDQAVAGSLAYLEQHAITATRRSGSDRVVVPTTGAVAAVFTHAVSRNGDPHLHSHVVMANLVHGCGRPLERLRPAGDRGPPHGGSRRSTRRTCAPGWRPPSASGGRRRPGRTGRDRRRRDPSCSASSRLGARTSAATCTKSGARSGRGARVAWAATRPAKAPGAPFADARGPIGSAGPWPSADRPSSRSAPAGPRQARRRSTSTASPV